MLGLKKVVLVVSIVVATFFLWLTAIDVALLRVAGNPEPLKGILADSGLYKSIVPGSLEQSKSISGSSGEVPLIDPLVRSAAEATFSPQYLQTTTNSVIDSIYRWLNNQTPQPDFKIDLTAKKTEFADNVAAAVEQRVASLPLCTSAITAASFDSFSAACRPAGVTPAQAGAVVRSDILEGQGFLDDPVISADSLRSADSNQSIFADQLKNAPDAYSKFKKSPLILGLVTLIALLSVVLLSSSRLKGVRNVGFVLAGMGLFLMIFALVINAAATSNQLMPKVNLSSAMLQADIQRLMRDMVHALDNNLLLMGAGYIVLGSLAAGFYLKRRRPRST